MRASEVVKLLGQIATVDKSFEYGHETLTFNVRIMDVETGGYDTRYLIEPCSGSGQRWVKAHHVTLPGDAVESVKAADEVA